MKKNYLLGLLFVGLLVLTLGANCGVDEDADENTNSNANQNINENTNTNDDSTDEIIIEDEEIEISCAPYLGDWFIHVQEGGDHMWNEIKIQDCEYDTETKAYTGKAESLMSYVPVPQLGMKTVALSGYFGTYTITGDDMVMVAENGSSTFTGSFIHENLVVGTWVNNNSGVSGSWSGFRTSQEFNDYLDELVEEDLEPYGFDVDGLETLQGEL